MPETIFTLHYVLSYLMTVEKHVQKNSSQNLMSVVGFQASKIWN